MRCEHKVPMAAARHLWKKDSWRTYSKAFFLSLPSAALNSYIVRGTLTKLFNHRWDIMPWEMHWVCLLRAGWSIIAVSFLSYPVLTFHGRKFHLLELLWFGIWSLLLAAVPNQFWSVASRGVRKPLWRWRGSRHLKMKGSELTTPLDCNFKAI